MAESAAEFCARQCGRVANGPEEWDARIDLDTDTLAIQNQRNSHREDITPIALRPRAAMSRSARFAARSGLDSGRSRISNFEQVLGWDSLLPEAETQFPKPQACIIHWAAQNPVPCPTGMHPR
jgi:hypothetical protein